MPKSRNNKIFKSRTCQKILGLFFFLNKKRRAFVILRQKSFFGYLESFSREAAFLVICTLITAFLDKGQRGIVIFLWNQLCTQEWKHCALRNNDQKHVMSLLLFKILLQSLTWEFSSRFSDYTTWFRVNLFFIWSAVTELRRAERRAPAGFCLHFFPEFFKARNLVSSKVNNFLLVFLCLRRPP